MGVEPTPLCLQGSAPARRPSHWWIPRRSGAEDGNRTRDPDLASRCVTTTLHPRAGTTGGVGGSRTLKPLRVAGVRDQVRRHIGGATPFRRRVIVLGKAPATRLRSATRGPPASSTGDGHRPVHRALSARGGLGGNRTHVYRFKRPVQDPAFATNPNPAAGTPPARSHVVPPSGIEPEPSALQADAQTTYARAG